MKNYTASNLFEIYVDQVERVYGRDKRNFFWEACSEAYFSNESFDGAEVEILGLWDKLKRV